MKKAYEKIKALVEELQGSGLEHNGGCFAILALEEGNSDNGVISVYGAPDDLGPAIVNFMLSDERSAMTVKKAVKVYDFVIEGKQAQAKKDKLREKHLS